MKILSEKPLIRAYCGDCMDLMAGKGDGFWDLAICDPPYGIGGDKQIKFGKGQRKLHDSKEWDNEIPTEGYFIELFRISCNQIVWGGNYFIEYLHNTKSFIVWDKMNGTNPLSDAELAWTSFDKPIRMIRRHIFSGVGNTHYQTIHPTQKPVALYLWLLTNYANPGQTILDTHGGSFSSAIACWKMGFDLDICEMDEEYFEAACSRFERETRQGSMFG